MSLEESRLPAVDAVRAYYDVNTRRWFRRARASYAIHRAVWGDGVRSQAEALRYVDRLVLREIQNLSNACPSPMHVLDLGCGICDSLIFLASHTTIRATGVTISGVQAMYAHDRIARAGLADRVQCLESDFLHLPNTIERAHVAFSIEAFIHGPDPAAYFASTADHIESGGLLIVCDDFLTEHARGHVSRREARMLEDVRSGWLTHSLITLAEAEACAQVAGYRQLSTVDLTPNLDLGRPRDRLVAAAVAVGRHLPLRGFSWLSLVGGSALQSALVAGLIEFRFVVWRKGSSNRAWIPARATA